MPFLIENMRANDPLQRARAETFLLENADPGVRARPQDQIERAISTGQGLLVHRGGSICGISLVYQYDPGAPGLVDFEIGTMRVTTEGFGLQVFLAWLHLIQITLEDIDTRGAIFAVVAPATASAHNLSGNAGMVPWTPTPTLALLRRRAGVPFVDGKSVLIANEAAIAAAYARLRASHLDGHRFRTPKGDEAIEIQMGWFEASLLDRVPLSR